MWLTTWWFSPIKLLCLILPKAHFNSVNQSSVFFLFFLKKNPTNNLSPNILFCYIEPCLLSHSLSASFSALQFPAFNISKNPCLLFVSGGTTAQTLTTSFTSMSLKLFCTKQEMTIQLYQSLIPGGFPSSFQHICRSLHAIRFPQNLCFRNLRITDSSKFILTNEHAPIKAVITPNMCNKNSQHFS